MQEKSSEPSSESPMRPRCFPALSSYRVWQRWSGCALLIAAMLGIGVNAAAQGSAPPAQGSAPPAQGSAPPAQGSAPAAQGSAPPAQGSAPAAQGSAPPAQGSAPPAQGSAPAAQGSAPAAQGSAPAAQGSAPAAQATPAPVASPPADAAVLHVEPDAGTSGVFDVFIDGNRVGTTPWEGPVDMGTHTVWITNDTFGSTPARVDTFEGEAKFLRLTARPLGPPVRVQVNPKTAELRIENVFVGIGQWNGRLPLGLHALSASERGYRRFDVALRVVPATEPMVVRIRLEVDPDHPRWPKPRRGLSWLGLAGGVGWTPSLGSDAEADCPEACTGHTGALGVFAGARGAYRLRPRLSFELEAGYLQLDTSFKRTKNEPFSSTMQEVTYNLEDELRLAGPFVSVGTGYGLPVGNWLTLSAGLQIGLLIASSSDPVKGSAALGSTDDVFTVDNAGESVKSVAFFLLPEIAALVRVGPVEFGPVLRIGGFPLDGPDFEYRSTRVTSSPVCTGGMCTPDSSVLREQAYGPFFFISPQLRIGYAFQ